MSQFTRHIIQQYQGSFFSPNALQMALSVPADQYKGIPVKWSAPQQLDQFLEVMSQEIRNHFDVPILYVWIAIEEYPAAPLNGISATKIGGRVRFAPTPKDRDLRQAAGNALAYAGSNLRYVEDITGFVASKNLRYIAVIGNQGQLPISWINHKK